MSWQNLWIAGWLVAVATVGGVNSTAAQIYSEGFEDNSGRMKWQGGAGERGGQGRVWLQNTVVHGGTQALAWQYDFRDVKPQAGVYSRCRLNVLLPAHPQRLVIWVYSDNSGRTLQYRLRDATGRFWQQYLGKLDRHGWLRLDSKFKTSAPAWGGKPSPQGGFTYPLTLVEFIIGGETPDKFQPQGTIYLDDLDVFEDDAGR